MDCNIKFPNVIWSNGYPVYDLRYAMINMAITDKVANYSALPSAVAATDKYYYVLDSQGTSWLPGSLGGTYYPRGLYYSDGVTWRRTETPYQASQATVDAGGVTDQFVSPNTLANSALIATKLSNILSTGQIFIGNGSNLAVGITPTLNLLAGPFSLNSTGVFTFPDASIINRGLVNTGTQSFLGVKTFASDVRMNGSLYFGNALGGVIIADTFQLYSVDIVAGNAAPVFKTENGDTIKIYAIGGWSTPSGTLNRSTFDPSTVTLTELAQRVAALITDLKTGHQLLKS